MVPVEEFRDGESRISSSRIREALGEFDFATAQALLGRPFTIGGRIRHGDKRGRTLGFATANIEPRRLTVPLLGVFAVRVHGAGSTPLPGVANMGTRPVFDGTRLLLEVHILDFSDDIYGEYIQVEFVQRLRGEEKFASVEDLLAQINRDIEEARELFS